MKKQLFLGTLCALLSFTVLQLNAQVSGQYPLMTINKNNGYAHGLGKLPVVEDDLLGRFQFRGWIMDGSYHPGAEIRSFVTGPVNNDGFPAALQFWTGYPDFSSRMIINAEGRVGIGTNFPDFDLHTVGNTHTTGDFYGRIHFDDNGSGDSGPSTYIDEAYFERHQRATFAVQPLSTTAEGGLFTLAPGGSSFDHQLYFADDGIFHRREDGAAANWTADWFKLLTSEDINGTPNRIAKFTAPSELGDSQLWDDGAQVGVGTDAPTAGFLLDVNGDTRIGGRQTVTELFTAESDAMVGGAATVAGNFFAQSNAQVSNNVSVGNDLNVGGNANVNGNTLLSGNTDVLGLLTVQSNANFNSNIAVSNLASVGSNLSVGGNTDIDGNLDVLGTTYLEGTVSIATTSTPGSHELYIGGSAIAEEVVVKLETNWPDYVFAADYPRPKIKDWEQHIAEHQHLPGMPSAADMAERDGVAVGETQLLLLEKIEELTLMLIDQQKEIDQLKAQLESK